MFGELFGGVYPHPDVPDRGHQPVQKGVYYSPEIDFLAFDIQIVKHDGQKQWLNYHLALKLFKTCELFHAEPLKEGTLSECFAFGININSTIPERLGLPAIPQNQMEGIVIKAVETVFMSPSKNNMRAIFKKKNPKFAEVNPKCETQWDKKKAEKKAAVDVVYEEIGRYINENRLNNLQSKFGPVTRENSNEAALQLADDALKDFIKDYEETWALIDDEDMQKVTRKNVKSKAAQWLAGWLTKEDK